MGRQVNDTDTGSGFWTLQNNHCSSLIKHGRELIENIVPVQRLNRILSYSFQRFIDENRAVFEIYITPCQSQNLPFVQRACKCEMNGNPEQRKSAVLQ